MRCWEGTLERLTLRSSETSHENGVCCTHFKSKECLEAGGNCAYGCKWEEAVWARLAEFEDSGLETWQADAAKSIVEMAFGGEISSIERIRDLVRADKAGMNITLPCKPGDKLFVLTTDSLGGIEETKCNPNPYSCAWGPTYVSKSPVCQMQTELFAPYVEAAIRAWNERYADGATA